MCWAEADEKLGPPPPRVGPNWQYLVFEPYPPTTYMTTSYKKKEVKYLYFMLSVVY